MHSPKLIFYVTILIVMHLYKITNSRHVAYKL